jgi:ribosomal protein S13
LDEATVACVGSTDRLCKYRPAFAKAEKYCADNKMSDTQCKELMNAVTKKALSLTDDQIDEIKQTTDKFKQVTEEIRRKNAK